MKKSKINNGIQKRNPEVSKTAPVRGSLIAHGFKPSKSMGQNFLTDVNIPVRIVKSSGIDKSCGVLEVGPGQGALTAELVNTAGRVTAVELDKRLVPLLQRNFYGQENINILQGDILKLDISKLVNDTLSGLILHVCANLPYNITTPALTAFIESDSFDSITVMLQKEVAQRICAKPGTPEYGAFTVYANYHTEPEILFDVSPDCFTPRPKVISSVIKMLIRKEKQLDKEQEKTFFKVVRAAFGQRRKTLVNALHSVFIDSYDKDKITGLVSSCGFDTRIRGEKLNIDEFIDLARLF